jgi:hypothetical protein
MLQILLTVLVIAAPAGEKIYFGKSEGARNPAVIAARSVFLEIEEYKKLVDKGLTDKDPEYFVLLAEANRKFYAAVTKAAGDHKYDCVAEEGTVTIKAVDATSQVIGALKSP